MAGSKPKSETSAKSPAKKEKAKEAEVVSSSSGADKPQDQKNADAFAIASLVVGVINLCAWCLPICGCPLSVVGIVLGILGLKSEERKVLAIIGLVLSGLGLLASIINGLLGVVGNYDTSTYYEDYWSY